MFRKIANEQVVSYKSANHSKYVASKTIWRIEEMHPKTPTTLNKIIMPQWIQNRDVCREGPKVAE